MRPAFIYASSLSFQPTSGTRFFASKVNLGFQGVAGEFERDSETEWCGSIALNVADTARILLVYSIVRGVQ